MTITAIKAVSKEAIITGVLSFLLSIFNRVYIPLDEEYLSFYVR